MQRQLAITTALIICVNKLESCILCYRFRDAWNPSHPFACIIVVALYAKWREQAQHVNNVRVKIVYITNQSNKASYLPDINKIRIIKASDCMLFEVCKCNSMNDIHSMLYMRCFHQNTWPIWHHQILDIININTGIKTGIDCFCNTSKTKRTR